MRNIPILKYFILACAIIFAKSQLSAQVDAQFTHFADIPGYYNPAAIGNSDFINVHLVSRLQWVGIPKAPVNFLAMGDMPFKFIGKRFATGLVISQESMGLYKSVNAAAQIAFKRRILKGELTIGAQVGVLNETFKGSEVVLPTGDTYHQGNDDAIPTTDIAGSALDVNAGIFYSHKYFWLGASATHLTKPTVSLSANSNQEQIYEFNAGRVYYFMAGSNIPIKNTLFQLQPSALAKTDTKFFQAEGALRVLYRNFLSAGVGYRWKDAVSLLIGAEYKNFTVGYSFDYPTSAISKVSNGSHEVFFGYKVKLDLGEKNKNKHKSIRIM